MSCYGGTEHVADKSGPVFKGTQASEAHAPFLHIAALSLMSHPIKLRIHVSCPQTARLSHFNHDPPFYSNLHTWAYNTGLREMFSTPINQ